MSASMTFKCPSCGGFLEFDPTQQKFKCYYCGHALSEEELREQSEVRQAEAEADQAASEAPEKAQMKAYQCQMCGAEIVTDETTAATRCYFCHSPVVLHDRLDDDFRPDGVIPFRLSKEEAEKQFLAHVQKKKFVDRAFFDAAQLEMFSGVYYPWWYADVEGDASFEGEGKRTSVMTTATHIVTTHRLYHVEREGRLSFRNLARKALTKADGKLSDGIHPYDVSETKAYAGGFLSGFLAEKRDIPEETAKGEMTREAHGYAQTLMQRDHGFNALSGTASFKPEKVEMRYVLLPAWVLTYKGGKDGAPYYYMMNGQTGKVCGRFPIDKKRLLVTALGVGIAVFLLLCGGGAFIW